ncbi:MAG TPA: response regulator [Geomonas sp.]|nr:response regulator [Geomonas sp.]
MTTRIVLAEDNERLATMLQGFLESLGHRVTWAPDGLTALALLQDGGVDLLILDLKLPGMNGVELLKTVRRSPELKGVEVIIMTGVYRGEAYAQAAQKLGVRAYLEKPFGKEDFLQAVNSVEGPAQRPLPDLLIEAFRNRLSGTVQLGALEVTLLKGEPLSFSSQDFIPFLLSAGLLSRSDLEQYPQQGQTRLRLCEAGLLSYDELLDQSRLFLSKKLTEAIQRNQPAGFQPDSLAPELPLTPISLPRLLHVAVRGAAASFQTGPFLERCGELYPARTCDYYRLANLFNMSREEIDLLEQLGRRPRVAELVSAGSDRAKNAAFLDLLVRVGMLALHSAPQAGEEPDFPQKRLFNRPIEEAAAGDSAVMSFDDLVDEVSDSVELVVGEEGMAAPLSATEITFEQDVQRDYAAIQDKNYYEIFAMTQASFTFAGLKDAYFAKTREYSPERFMELSGATLARAQDVLSHYANAYNTLSNVIAKERYDEMLKANSLGSSKEEDQLQARIQFQSGKVFLEMGDFPHAEKALQEAYTLDPQDAQTCAYLAWSIYQNPANRGSSAASEKSRNLLSKSLQMGRCAEAFAFRGWMLLDEGRDGLAEGEFLKALKVNARERNAQKGMQVIAERREAEKKGLFKRIFG